MEDKPYIFKHRFEDTQGGLSKTDGLSIKELATVLKALDDVSDPGDGSKITLSEIQDGSYVLLPAMISKVRYENLVKTHENIEYKGFDELTNEDRKYARVLSRTVLSPKSRFLETYDNEGNIISKIYSRDIGKSVDHFFKVTTISGIISEIGSPNLRKQTHIDVHNFGYRIFTNEEQDVELRKYYRSQKLQFKIKQKVSVVRKKVISAKLIDFKPYNTLSLYENISKLRQEDLSIVKDIHSHEEIIRLVRS